MAAAVDRSAWICCCASDSAPGAVQLLAKNFAAMQRLGDPVLKPFLQVSRPPPEQYQHALHAGVPMLAF